MPTKQELLNEYWRNPQTGQVTDPFIHIPEGEGYLPPRGGLERLSREQLPEGYTGPSYGPAAEPGLERGFREFAGERERKGLRAIPYSQYAKAYGQSLEEIRGPEPFALPEVSADPMKNWQQARQVYAQVINKGQQLRKSPEEIKAELEHRGVAHIDPWNPPQPKKTEYITGKKGENIYKMMPDDTLKLVGTGGEEEDLIEATVGGKSVKLPAAAYTAHIDREAQRELAEQSRKESLELKKMLVETTAEKYIQKGLPGETAGKLSMAKQAVNDLIEAKDLLFKDGKYNPNVFVKSKLPWGAMSPEAQKFSSRIKNALAAKLRIETGAAATTSEIDDLYDRFAPSLGDDPLVAKDRMDRLLSNHLETIKYIDPSGRYTGQMAEQPGAAATGGGKTVTERRQLPDGRTIVMYSDGSKGIE